jgi:hypothetical protein
MKNKQKKENCRWATLKEQANNRQAKIICPRCKVSYSEHTCYWSSCIGCPKGHSSFHKTIIESPQWKKWRKYAWEDKMLYDFPECEELGIIGEEHFQDFIKFVIKVDGRKVLIKEIEELIVKEILIAHKEGQRTSRLTSLMMALKRLK